MIAPKIAGWLIAGLTAAGVSGVSLVAAAPLNDALHPSDAKADTAGAQNVTLPEQASAHAAAALKHAVSHAVSHEPSAKPADSSTTTHAAPNSTTSTASNTTQQAVTAPAASSQAAAAEEEHVNKVAQALADYYHVKLDVIEALHAQGFGYGELAKAFAGGKTTLADAQAALTGGHLESAHTTNLGAIVSGHAAPLAASHTTNTTNTTNTTSTTSTGANTPQHTNTAATAHDAASTTTDHTASAEHGQSAARRPAPTASGSTASAATAHGNAAQAPGQLKKAK